MQLQRNFLNREIRVIDSEDNIIDADQYDCTLPALLHDLNKHGEQVFQFKTTKELYKWLSE